MRILQAKNNIFMQSRNGEVTIGKILYRVIMK